MNFTSKSKVVVLLLAVVGITVATNFATDYFKGKNSSQQQVFYNEAGFRVPASLANYTPGQGLVDFTAAAEMSVHAVVHVKTKTPVQQQQFGFNNPFFEHFFGRPQMPQQQQEAPLREGSGSGVIISTDGYIVTNNHVIDGSKEIEVTMNDNQTFKATLVGADANTDIALLKIEADNLPVIPFGNSDDLKVGEWVLAVGNPFNLTSTVTAGIVSAKARNINILNASMKIESFIQTDAAVNPGNSGGALVNTRGELVGINTAIASRTGSFAGYAFAVPTSIVQKVVSDMRKFGVVQRAVLGVRMGDITSEKMELDYYEIVEGGSVSSYIHPGNKLVTVVAFAEKDADNDTMRGVAMHIAAMSPVAIDESAIPQKVKDTELAVAIEKTKTELVAKEVEVALKKAGINPAHVDSEAHIESNMSKGWITAEVAAQAREIIETVTAEKSASLPEQKVNSIAAGRMAKFFKEFTLLEQKYEGGSEEAGKTTVKELLAKKHLTCTGFKRVTLNQE